MSLPFDEGRNPRKPRRDYRSGPQFLRDEFREKYSKFEYWRNRPLIELQIKIRKLEKENSPESQSMAQRLRQIESEVHDEQRAQQSLHSQRRGSRSAPSSPTRGTRATLPPSAISGRITGGNLPRHPTVADFHPGYSQMSSRTQSLLDERHRAAQTQARSLPNIPDRRMDRRIEQMRQYDIGLRREPYTSQMRMGVGLDVDRFREEVPRTLAQSFRDLRIGSDRERKRDSKYTKLASLEVWKQRQLDKKYHPRPMQQSPRQHQFGPQQPQQYRDDWRHEAKKTMPFAPVYDHFGSSDREVRPPRSLPAQQSKFKDWTSKMRSTVPKSTISSERVDTSSRERSWSRSAPDLFEAAPSMPSTSPSFIETQQSRRPAFDPERPPLGQRVASSYLDLARTGDAMSKEERSEWRRRQPELRRQRRPFREDEENLGIDMSENAQEWELAQRHITNTPLASLGDYSRRQRMGATSQRSPNRPPTRSPNRSARRQ